MRRRAVFTRTMTPETKFVDVSNPGVPINQINGHVLLNGLLRGSATSQRIGAVARATSVDLKIRLISTGGIAFVRVMLFIDREPHGATITDAQLFENSTTPNNLLSPVNMSSRQRVVLLFNKTYPITAADTLLRYITISRRLGFRQVWDDLGNSPTIGNMQSNALYFYVITDLGGGTAPAVSFYCRYRFRDA